MFFFRTHSPLCVVFRAVSAYNDLSWVHMRICVCCLIRFVCADFDSFRFQIDLLSRAHKHAHALAHTLQVMGKVNTTIYLCCHFFIISSTSSTTFKVNIEKKIEFQFFFIHFDDFIAFNSVLSSLVNGAWSCVSVLAFDLLDWNDAMRCVYLQINLSINLYAHILSVDVTVIVQREQKKVSISSGLFVYSKWKW